MTEGTLGLGRKLGVEIAIKDGGFGSSANPAQVFVGYPIENGFGFAFWVLHSELVEHGYACESCHSGQLFEAVLIEGEAVGYVVGEVSGGHDIVHVGGNYYGKSSGVQSGANLLHEVEYAAAFDVLEDI